MGKYTVQTKVFAVDEYCSGPYTKTVVKGRGNTQFRLRSGKRPSRPLLNLKQKNLRPISLK